jgi:hypothetical protein
MSHTTNILLIVIQERIQNKINIELEEKQFGLRKNSGTRETIFCIREVNKNKKVYLYLFYRLHQNFWQLDTNNLYNV